ncbi:flavodoxin family protein [Chloroflexota bacterium]
MKKILVVMGSPRRNGNSATLAQNVIAGAKSAGATVDSYYLHGMNIKPCDACGVCRENDSRECIIDDDMQELYLRLRDTDALVIASPIYYFTVSAQTKLFIDRWYALGKGKASALNGKQIGIILTYEDPDPFISGAVNALRTFQDIFNYLGARVVAMIYGRASEASEIKTNQELMDKAYKLGQELATQK